MSQLVYSFKGRQELVFHIRYYVIISLIIIDFKPFFKFNVCTFAQMSDSKGLSIKTKQSWNVKEANGSQ